MAKNNMKIIFPGISDAEQWERVDDEVKLYYLNYSEFAVIKHDIKELDEENQFLIIRSLLEARCIHARNLCEIFTNNTNSSTDINIEKLDHCWALGNQTLINNLLQAYSLVTQSLTPKDSFDKFLFHPTLNRKFVPYLENPLIKIHPELTALISALPPDKVPSRGNFKFLFPTFGI